MEKLYDVCSTVLAEGWLRSSYSLLWTCVWITWPLTHAKSFWYWHVIHLSHILTAFLGMFFVGLCNLILYINIIPPSYIFFTFWTFCRCGGPCTLLRAQWCYCTASCCVCLVYYSVLLEGGGLNNLCYKWVCHEMQVFVWGHARSVPLPQVTSQKPFGYNTSNYVCRDHSTQEAAKSKSLNNLYNDSWNQKA